jgi:hypothetical protein
MYTPHFQSNLVRTGSFSEVDEFLLIGLLPAIPAIELASSCDERWHWQ